VTQADPLTGRQEPVFRSVPAADLTSGDEVVALMEQVAGVELLPWQRAVLDAGLGMRRRDGKWGWSAFEVAMILARQNGKNVVLEARELGGLFLLGERLILHTAHQYKTSQEAFRRVDELVTGSDVLRRKVRRVVRTNGEEGVELLSGARLRFLARSKASGRGFTADCLILDEAYDLGDDAMSALLPTMSTRPNPQLWYASSAGREGSVQLGRVWRRGRKAAASGKPDPSLAYFEWSADLCTVFCRPDCTQHDRMDDPQVWAKTNPSLSVLIPPPHVAHEMATMSPEDFAVERLSVGDYPSDEAARWAVVAEDQWKILEDAASQVRNPVAFAVEVAPERRAAAVGVAGQRRDGRLHVEVIRHARGTEWVVPKVAELYKRWRPVAIVVDPGSHAGALVEALTQAGVAVTAPFTARNAAEACSQFYDAVVQGDIRHMGQGPLTAALAGAKTRRLSDAWAWDRTTPVVDISPLTAVTLALWGFNRFGRSAKAPYDLLNSVR
jgi:hypothetical protein